jgi:hypothetical protein
VETLISGAFRTYYYAGDSYYPSFAFSVAADELSASWGNFGMQDFGSEPRVPFNNDPSYNYSAVAETPWYNSYSAISAALDGLTAISDGLVIGDQARTQRAKAFAEFVIGLSHAHIAMVFDKGFVVTEVPEGTFDPENLPFEMVSYQEVFQGALTYFDQAIQTAENSSFSEIPSGWMGETTFTKDEFIGLIKTYRAHFRASLPRSPEERASVDWQAVISDIDAGYTEMTGDFIINDPQENWFSGFRYYGKNSGWTRVDYRTIGPADLSGNYQDWLNSDLNSRLPFDVTTDDRRITGATNDPQSDGKYIHYAGAAPFPQDRGIYHYSNYVYYRNPGTFENYAQGNQKWLILQSTMRLLKAEALLHMDPVANKAEVVDIINETRVTNGELSPAAITDAVGSMSDPQNALDGASLWSKLKHEKRIESFATTTGLAYYDKRGWGDLVSGTPVHLPIPGQELQLLQQAIYTTGSNTNGDSPKSTAQ